MLGSLVFLTAGAYTLPHIHRVRGFQDKHIIGVQFGGGGIHLEKKRQTGKKCAIRNLYTKSDTKGYVKTAHLHSPGSMRRALSDVEETSAAGLRLSTFA